MKRRQFLGSAAALALAAKRTTAEQAVKVFGVSLTPNSDRPYVFAKLETDAGLIGWGEGTLEHGLRDLLGR